jgi:ribosomal protein L35
MPKRKTKAPERFRVTVKGAPESPESHQATIKLLRRMREIGRRILEEEAAASKNSTGADV